MKKLYSKIKNHKSNQHLRIVFIVLGISIIGSLLLSYSRAATPYASFNAANGQLAGSASIVTNSSASEGQDVRFGTPSNHSASACSAVFSISVFCMPVANASVVSNSAAMVSSFVNQYKNNYGTVNVNNTDYGEPIYRVSASQALSSVTYNPSCGGGSFITQSVPVPSGATPAAGTDHSAIFYQPSTGKDWEFWEFNNTNGVYTACAGGEINPVTASNGVFPTSGSQLASSGISYLATDITESDIVSGVINHAIAVQILYCNGAYISPARSNYDCGNNGDTSNIIPYGQYFRFSSTVIMPSGLTPLAQLIFKAIQTYGMVVTDKSGAVALSAETAAGWQLTGNSGDPISAAMDGQPNYAIVTSLPWSQLQAITEP